MTGMKRALRGVLFAGWAAGAMAQTAALPPVEAFFNEPGLREFHLAPDGRKLALTFGADDRRVGLYVLDLADVRKVKLVAQFTDADVGNVHWVNAERLVFSARDYSAGGGRAHGNPGLYAVDANGENQRLLVHRGYRDGSQASTIVQRTLEANHKLLAVPRPSAARVNEEVLVGELRWERDESVSVTPHWLDTRTGKTRDLGFKVPGQALEWYFDGQGEARAVLTGKDSQVQLHWRAPGQTSWQLLVEGEQRQLPFVPHSVDDSGQLFVTHEQGAQRLEVLSRYDFAAKAPAQALIAVDGFDFDGALLKGEAGKPALGVRLKNDAETTVWFDKAHQRMQTDADAKLPGRVNRLTCVRCDQPDRVAMVWSFSDTDAGKLWLHRGQPGPEQQAWELLSVARPKLPPAQMGQTDLHRIRARDGRDLPVWVTQPRKALNGKPAVVLVHGGPRMRGYSWEWDNWTQFLASRGYVVIAPEFRGSAGYGFEHEQAGFKQWGRAMQDDVTDALQWARKQGMAGDKACIAGASYGGYSTLMGLARDPELYRCGVAWMAVTDLELFVKGSWLVKDDISDLARKFSIPDTIGDPEKDLAMLRQNSPIHRVDDIKAPLLLAHGSDDRRVPQLHAERLQEALRKAGRAPEWVSYPGEGHYWALLKTRVDFAQRVERFLAQHLQ